MASSPPIRESWAGCTTTCCTHQAPYFDSDGLLYTFTGTANTISGSIQGDGVSTVNLFYYTGYYSEEYYNSTTYSTYGDTVGSFSLVSDGGVSGAAGGNVLSATCGYTGTRFVNVPAQLGFCYSISNTLTTSPYLPWTVYGSGVFSVYSNSLSTGILEQSVQYPGLVIFAATLNRTIWAQGNGGVTQQFTLSAPNTYNGNDNILQPSGNSVPFISLHGVGFQSTTPIVGVTGTTSTVLGGTTGSLMYLNLNDWVTSLPRGYWHHRGGSAIERRRDRPTDFHYGGQLRWARYPHDLHLLRPHTPCWCDVVQLAGHLVLLLLLHWLRPPRHQLVHRHHRHHHHRRVHRHHCQRPTGPGGTEDHRQPSVDYGQW